MFSKGEPLIISFLYDIHIIMYYIHTTDRAREDIKYALTDNRELTQQDHKHNITRIAFNGTHNNIQQLIAHSTQDRNFTQEQEGADRTYSKRFFSGCHWTPNMGYSLASMVDTNGRPFLSTLVLRMR
jgi:hypothetical protein